MWENAYLSIKNPKASALLHHQLSDSEAAPLPRPNHGTTPAEDSNVLKLNCHNICH